MTRRRMKVALSPQKAPLTRRAIWAEEGLGGEGEGWESE
jgi:hypothetical protein